QVLRRALALLVALRLHAALVVLEVGLHAAGEVEVLVALALKARRQVDRLDELGVLLGHLAGSGLVTRRHRRVRLGGGLLHRLVGGPGLRPRRPAGRRVDVAHLSSSTISASTTSSSPPSDAAPS